MPASPRSRAFRRRRGPTAGTQFGPDTGGTQIEIDGAGFANQALFVSFADVASPFSFGTQYNFTATGDTKLTTHTVGQNPAVVDTQVCTVTDCSEPTSPDNDLSDVLFLYPPGNPKIDSITPASGPANGGTPVTITGENLGCVTNVSFGSVAAVDATNAAALLDCGSTDTVTVTAPAGSVGTVPITLSTVESDATGAPVAQASFTYTKAPLQSLTVRKSGNGSGKITSSPVGIKLPEDVLAQVPLRQLGDPEGEGLQGLRLRRLVGRGRVHQEVDVQDQSQREPPGDREVHAQELRGAERQGQEPFRGEAALKAHACSAGKIKHAFSSRVKTGRVISQSPQAGSHLKHNGKVSLTVSEGPKH